MWIEREALPLVRQRLAHHPVVVLTGARQTGKTSLARHALPEAGYITLDLPSEAEQAERDPTAFLARHPAPLIVDEVQYAPALFRHLKTVVDAHRDLPGQYLLTGSQPFALMREVADSLAGRASVLQLTGLTWAEIRVVHPHLDPIDVLLRGGFPELYRNLDIDPQGFFRSYVTTYLERDLRQQQQNVGNLRDFERFIRGAALRTAGLLNRSDLARDVGISPSTAGLWLSALEAGGLVTLLEPWFMNTGKSLAKSPKLHGTDSGLTAFLMGITRREDLLASPLRGNLWESAVIANLRATQINRTGGADLWYWRDRSHEVDVVIHEAGRFRLADVKWSESPDAGDLRQLQAVAKGLPDGSVTRMAVLGRSANSYPLKTGAALAPQDHTTWLA